MTAATDTDGLPGGKGPVPCDKTQKDDTPWSSSNYAVVAGRRRPRRRRARRLRRLHQARQRHHDDDRDQHGGTPRRGRGRAVPGQRRRAGPCAGLTPAQTIDRIRSDAQAAAATSGFTGDPLRPLAGKAYGSMVSAARY